MLRVSSIKLWLSVLSVISIPENIILPQEPAPASVTEIETRTVTEAAHKKARELGYKPEQLEFELTRAGELYVANYYPKQHYEKGVVIYGGGLTIWIEKNGEIVRFQRQI